MSQPLAPGEALRIRALIIAFGISGWQGRSAILAAHWAKNGGIVRRLGVIVGGLLAGIGAGILLRGVLIATVDNVNFGYLDLVVEGSVVLGLGIGLFAAGCLRD